MFNYEIMFQKPNDPQWYHLTNWARPFTDGTTLDETLDEGKINLSLTKRQKPLPPFTKIKIEISEVKKDGTKEKVGEINRVVGSTRRTRRTFDPSSPTLYDWSIQTLEETKLLERYICDSMMSTNYLITNYAIAPVPGVLIKNEGVDDPIPKFGYIYSPNSQDSAISLPKISTVLDLPLPPSVAQKYNWGRGKINIISPNGQIVFSEDWQNDNSATLHQIGLYQIQYDGQYGRSDFVIGEGWYPYVYHDFTVQYSVYIVGNMTFRKDPTITSVCERLLSAGITRREGIDTQKFTLDPVFATKYANVPAPEFSFTRQTLFEALLTVGGYIHAIPRLNGTVVTFDELGGDDEIDMSHFPKMVYEDVTQDINDFCSTIDSPAQNLLNTQDRVKGSITEFGNDYITVRAEDADVIIDANTAIIRTSLPINQIVKLECGYISDKTTPVGDITAYVYEAAEYDTLSSMWDSAYPYSKGFALRYTQGDNKITGLQAKLEYPTSIQKDLANPAIINIIQAVTGKKINSTDIHNLAFRVTYVPIVTSRVTQRKPYGSTNGANNNAGWDNSLVYNQGGNVVESSFYGDKMKGAIARLGNEVVQQTYDFYHYAQLPKCGQKLNGMYIARVDAEYDITRIRATLTLTKDFNMLSQYVGLNSNYRLYDISEKQSVERYINYSENIYVGDEVEYDMTIGAAKPMLQNLRNGFGNIVRIPNAGYKPELQRVFAAIATGTDKDGNDIGNPVYAPVVAFPFGNSLVFSFSMYDNYGAGFQNSDLYLNDNKYKGVQRLVPYADGLGEMENMSIAMRNSYPLDEEESNLYPAVKDYSYSPGIVNTDNHPFIVKKDSREALSVVYQAHFVANRQSIVLGPALAGSNAFVVGKNDKLYKVYFFTRQLNMLDKIIDLNGATQGGLITYERDDDHNNRQMKFTAPAPTAGKYQSWGLIELESDNSVQGRLVFGENADIVAGVTPPTVCFTSMANE